MPFQMSSGKETSQQRQEYNWNDAIDGIEVFNVGMATDRMEWNE